MRTCKTTFLLISCMAVLISCEDEQQEVLIKDTAIEMTFSDAEGNDLLNPDFAGSFNAADIDLYYLRDGQKEKVYDAFMDHPENFFIMKSGSKYYMRLFPNEYGDRGLTTTYLKLSETDTDTINCQLRKLNRNNESVAVASIWYNGELVWDGEGVRYFEVIK